jgi:hypothetical protein
LFDDEAVERNEENEAGEEYEEVGAKEAIDGSWWCCGCLSFGVGEVGCCCC